MKFTSDFSADGPVATISQRGLLAMGVAAPTPTYPSSSRTRQSHQAFSSFGNGLLFLLFYQKVNVPLEVFIKAHGDVVTCTQ
jgi:hypothetical protein